MTERRLALAVAAALTLTVLLLSLLPGVAEEGDRQFQWHVAAVPSALQNAMHLVLYAALAVAWLWALRPDARPLRTVLLLIAFGAAIELAQLFVPGRFAGLLDAGLNAAGVLLGAGLFGPLRRYLKPEPP